MPLRPFSPAVLLVLPLLVFDGLRPVALASQSAGAGGATTPTRHESGRPGDARASEGVPAGALIATAERELAAGRAEAALAAFERASAELGKLLLFGRPDPDAWGDAGRRVAAGSAQAYLRLDEPYLARLAALRALNVDPHDAALQTLLGTSCYREGRFAEAAAAFAEALRVDAGFAPAQTGQGLIDLSANRLASARERFARAYELAHDPRDLWLLARVAFVERDYGTAARRLREYLERAKGLSPERRDEVRERARVYGRLGEGRGSRFVTHVTRGQLRFDVAKGDEVPLVPVRVGGREPVYFIFDTGAQDHVLDLGFARELRLDLSGPAGRIESPLGPVERRLAVIDSLNLEGILVANVPVSVADFRELGLRGRASYYVAGVLSPALLFRDFLVRVDFYHRTVTLERYDAGGRDYLDRRPALRRTAVPFRFNADGTGMILDAELGGTRGHPLLLDTGASDVYLSAPLARVLDLDPLDVTVALGEYRKGRLRAQFLRDLESGGDDALTEPGVAYEGILGYPFFRDMRLVFDYYHGVLLIES